MAIDIKDRGSRTGGNGKYWAAAVAILVAFGLSYGYASSARAAQRQSGDAQQQYASAGGYATAGGSGSVGGAGGCCGSGGAGASAGGGCCGGGGSQKTVAGSTTVSGGVQKVTIDLTTGSYSPNQITAKAGVPLELDFKGPASGCNGQVQSQDLGFSQDVSNGGTIKVAALQPGTYTFACSMNMYTAKIVVK
jgi:hypothetical protein